MKRLVPIVAGLSLMAGVTAGCSEPTFEQSASVTGYFYGENGQIVEDQWVHYEGQEDVPSGEVRNVHDYEVQDGCVEEYDWTGFEMDDPDCWGEWCSSGEDTYCKPEYDTFYDFDHKEEVVVVDCPAEIKISEFPHDKPTVDQACMNQRRDGQRFRKVSQFIVWLKTTNPKYAEEKHDGAQPTITQGVDVTARQWAEIAKGDRTVSVKIQGGRILEIIQT